MREELPDGRVKFTYGSGTTYYTPKSGRRNQKHPPGTEWWNGRPIYPLSLLPVDERVLPLTSPYRDRKPYTRRTSSQGDRPLDDLGVGDRATLDPVQDQLDGVEVVL